MKHIYLVHDNQEDPALRRQYLESVGFHVSLCTGSDELMRMLNEDKPGAVVMDILIQGMNGFEVCRRLRDRYTAEELPILLCTGIYRKQIFSEEAMEAGAQDYLVRPYNLDELVKKLHIHMDRAPVPT